MEAEHSTLGPDGDTRREVDEPARACRGQGRGAEDD